MAEETRARATARSAAGSVSFMPPTTFTYTSLSAKPMPACLDKHGQNLMDASRLDAPNAAARLRHARR